jgi:hypothetical protein
MPRVGRGCNFKGAENGELGIVFVISCDSS